MHVQTLFNVQRDSGDKNFCTLAPCTQSRRLPETLHTLQFHKSYRRESNRPLGFVALWCDQEVRGLEWPLHLSLLLSLPLSEEEEAIEPCEKMHSGTTGALSPLNPRVHYVCLSSCGSSQREGAGFSRAGSSGEREGP